MGDMGDIWRDIKAAKDEEKAAYMPGRIKAIEDLRPRGYRVDVIVDGYHYRVNGRLDLFPVNRRYHDIKAQKRGHYGKPENCVERVFGRGHSAAGVQQHGAR